MNRLQPTPVYVYSSHPIKWVAAFVLVALVTTTVAPFLVAPRTIADSQVLVQGQVFLLMDGNLWQPMQTEFPLTKSAFLQTGKNSAKIILYDDAVFRMAPNTTIALHDLTDRPAIPTYPTTLTVYKGKVWAQGFVADGESPLTIAVGDETVTLNEGSVSIDETGRVQVWNRRATIAQADQQLNLLAGEETHAVKNSPLIAQKIPSNDYDTPWVTKNLAFDAVHQREIAQIQQERLAAAAGILPTSPFYVVKRAAEAVDRAFTFTPEQKTKKILAQANTRLKEAAALIVDGSSDVSAPLAEYRAAVLSVASGSTVTQSLVQEDITNTTADLSAALPNDAGYQLKETVLGTAAALPNSSINVQDVLLADKLMAVKQTVEEGKDVQPNVLSDLAPNLGNQDSASPELQEAAASLSVAQNAFENVDGLAGTGASKDMKSVRPSHAPTSPIAADIPAAVGMLLGRMNTYHLSASITAQAVTEVRNLQGNPDRDAIIREAIRQLDAPYNTALAHALQKAKGKGQW